jgi:hypothetical protein
MKEEIIDGINYRLDEETKTAEVIEKRNGYEGDIIIPETVVLENTSYRVTSIENCAIYECPSLKSIIIGNSVTRIDDCAIYECSSLKSVIIGNSVTSIGEEAFGHCPLLRSVTFNGTIEQWGNVDLAFGWNDYVELVHCTDGDVKIG